MRFQLAFWTPEAPTDSEGANAPAGSRMAEVLAAFGIAKTLADSRTAKASAGFGVAKATTGSRTAGRLT